MKRLLLLAALGLSACAPTPVDIPATAAVAIRLTDEAMATKAPPATDTALATPTAAPSPTPSLDVGSTSVRPADGATMMYVPAGEFVMGNDQGRADEVPAHTVYLDAFWMDKTEVTAGMYEACVAAGGCQAFGSKAPAADVPLFNAPWENAAAYCSYAGARLPSEAEWEKAARGTDQRLYPWGMDMDPLKLVAFGGPDSLPPVGSNPDGASPYGVLDLAGSAFEWVADWYSPTYYATSPRDNPAGPESGKMHVIRGGWWEYTKGTNFEDVKTLYLSTYRNGTGAYGHLISHGRDYYPGAGFRCAMKAD